MKYPLLAFAPMLFAACQSSAYDNQNLPPKKVGTPVTAEGVKGVATELGADLENAVDQAGEAINPDVREASVRTSDAQEELNRLRRDMGLEPETVIDPLADMTAGAGKVVDDAEAKVRGEIEAAARNAEDWAVQEAPAELGENVKELIPGGTSGVTLPGAEKVKDEFLQAELDKLELEGKNLADQLDMGLEEAAKVDLPKLELPAIDLPDADIPAVDLPVVDLNEVDTLEELEPTIKDMEVADHPTQEDEVVELFETATEGQAIPAVDAVKETIGAAGKDLQKGADKAKGAVDGVMAETNKLKEAVAQTQEASAPIGTTTTAVRDEFPEALSLAEMEARTRELATPGPEHQVMDNMVGDFQATVQYWPAPGGEAITSTGTSKNTWALGGRFLQSDYVGTMMGQTFFGFGQLGFDKVRGQYVGYWIDSTSTQMMNISTGTASLNGKSITLRRVTPDAMTGKTIEMKEVLTIKDNNNHEWEMWGHGADGTYYRQAYIVYSRKK